MAKFCGSCGAQLSDNSAFCIQCGTAQNAAAPATPQPPVQPPPPPAQPAYAQVNTPPPMQSAYTPVNASAGALPPVKSSGSGLKILLGILAVLFVGALLVVGGLFYVGHRVVNKIKATAAENGLSLPSKEESSSASVLHADPCSLLSKDDVSSATGVPIIATKSTPDSCEYLAEGTAADMTARHVSAMAKAKGADSQQQDLIHQFAGGIFNAQQSESKDKTEENGQVPIIVVSIDTNNAREQMKLNSKILGNLGGGAGSGAIAGIGDEAFDTAGAMMFVRKGEKLIRIAYTTCPCTTDAIKPLARKLADGV